MQFLILIPLEATGMLEPIPAAVRQTRFPLFSCLHSVTPIGPEPSVERLCLRVKRAHTSTRTDLQ